MYFLITKHVCLLCMNTETSRFCKKKNVIDPSLCDDDKHYIENALVYIKQVTSTQIKQFSHGVTYTFRNKHYLLLNITHTTITSLNYCLNIIFIRICIVSVL